MKRILAFVLAAMMLLSASALAEDINLADLKLTYMQYNNLSYDSIACASYSDWMTVQESVTDEAPFLKTEDLPQDILETISRRVVQYAMALTEDAAEAVEGLSAEKITEVKFCCTSDYPYLEILAVGMEDGSGLVLVYGELQYGPVMADMVPAWAKTDGELVSGGTQSLWFDIPQELLASLLAEGIPGPVYPLPENITCDVNGVWDLFIAAAAANGMETDSRGYGSAQKGSFEVYELMNLYTADVSYAVPMERPNFEGEVISGGIQIQSQSGDYDYISFRGELTEITMQRIYDQMVSDIALWLAAAE